MLEPNEAQRSAITYTDGPLLVVAGAGTGKTAVLTKRAAYLVTLGLAKCEEILALTFTEKAATEMEERLDELLPYGYTNLQVHTFHGFAEKILTEFGAEIGLSRDLRVLTPTEASILFTKHWATLDFHYFRTLGSPQTQVPSFLAHFSRAADEGLTPKIYEQNLKNSPLHEETFECAQTGHALREFSEEQQEHLKYLDLSRAYLEYERLLHRQGALDFGFLLLELKRLLLERPKIKRLINERFRYALFDEFQDTNSIQYDLMRLIINEKQNVTVVGDDDQAIYRFRGASANNLLRFAEEFPSAKIICLTENFRSRQEILDAAYNFIQLNNPHRLEAQLIKLGNAETLSKRLVAFNGSGGKVQARFFQNGGTEADETVKAILTLKLADPTASWNDFVILLRINSAAAPFIFALEREGVPYRFYALEGLYLKPIIIDLLAHLRILINPYDSVSFARALNSLTTKFTAHDLATLGQIARLKGKSLYEISLIAETIPQLSLEGIEKLQKFFNTFNKIAERIKRANALEATLLTIRDIKLVESVNLQAEARRLEDFSFLEQFIARLKHFARLSASGAKTDASLANFIKEIDHELESGDSGALRFDPDTGPEFVRLMTIHSAKGLEFKHVFLGAAVEGKFPGTNRQNGIPLPPEFLKNEPEGDTSLAHLLEERRLFYVAMTRAKESFTLSGALDYGGTRARKPSRFFAELGLEIPETTKTKGEVMNFSSDNKETEVHHAHFPKRMSFTQFMAFRTCPLQYKFAHIYRLPVFGSATLSFGKSLHALFERALRERVNNKLAPLPDYETLLTWLPECWIDEWYENDQEREKYLTSARTAARAFITDCQKNEAQPAFLEQPFSIKIGEFSVKGRIDRIDRLPQGGYEIIDYKTGKPKDLERLKKERDLRLQLVLYSLAASEVLGLDIRSLTYYYTDNGSRATIAATEKDRLQLKEEIQEIGAQILASSFNPTAGDHCRYCDFRTICEFRKMT